MCPMDAVCARINVNTFHFQLLLADIWSLEWLHQLSTHWYGGSNGHGHSEGGEGSATILDGWSNDDHPESVQQWTQHLVDAAKSHHRHPEAQQREEEVSELQHFILGEAVGHNLQVRTKASQFVSWCNFVSLHIHIITKYNMSVPMLTYLKNSLGHWFIWCILLIMHI